MLHGKLIEKKKKNQNQNLFGVLGRAGFENVARYHTRGDKNCTRGAATDSWLSFGSVGEVKPKIKAWVLLTFLAVVPLNTRH